MDTNNFGYGFSQQYDPTYVDTTYIRSHNVSESDSGSETDPTHYIADTVGLVTEPFEIDASGCCSKSRRTCCPWWFLRCFN